MAEKKRSIRETLKDLELTASSVNFNGQEDDFDSLTVAKVEASGGVDFDSQLLKREVGSLRNKALKIEESDPKYFGKVTSRKDLKEFSGSEEENSEDKDKEGGEKSDGESDEQESDEEGDEEKSDSDHKQSDEEDDEEDDAEETDQEEGDFGMTIDPSKLPADLQDAGITNGKTDDNDDDDEDGIAHFHASKVEDDIRKGKTTKLQLDMLDKLLESRIRLQKLLQIVNRLPQGNTAKEFSTHKNLSANEKCLAAKSSLKSLLDNLLSLQTSLFEGNPSTSSILLSETKNKKTEESDEEITSEEEGEEKEEKIKEEEKSLNLPSKRKRILTVDDYEEEVSKRHCVATAHHEQVINTWYEKTKITSAKINQKNFSAFDKSTVQQINQVLTDKERLIKRTKLQRTPYRILGTLEYQDSSNGGADAHLKEYNDEIFDDGDFYHEMLKELIERKTNVNSDDPVAIGRQWLELQKMRTKVKRKIDTRASKGRKVRYDVHTKLVNFMAPNDVSKFSDQAKNDLFSSLFGQPGGRITTT